MVVWLDLCVPVGSTEEDGGRQEGYDSVLLLPPRRRLRISDRSSVSFRSQLQEHGVMLPEGSTVEAELEVTYCLSQAFQPPRALICVVLLLAVPMHGCWALVG